MPVTGVIWGVFLYVYVPSSLSSGFGGCSPGTKTGTRVRSDVPQERKTGTRVRSHVPPERKTGTRVHSPKPPFYETALLSPGD